MVEAARIGCIGKGVEVPGERIFLAEPAAKLGTAGRGEFRRNLKDAGPRDAAQPLSEVETMKSAFVPETVKGTTPMPWVMSTPTIEPILRPCAARRATSQR